MVEKIEKIGFTSIK